MELEVVDESVLLRPQRSLFEEGEAPIGLNEFQDFTTRTDRNARPGADLSLSQLALIPRFGISIDGFFPREVRYSHAKMAPFSGLKIGFVNTPRFLSPTSRVWFFVKFRE